MKKFLLLFLLFPISVFANSLKFSSIQYNEGNPCIQYSTSIDETPEMVAKMFSIKKETLLAFNNLSSNYYFQANQKILIPLVETNFLRLKSLNEAQGFLPVYTIFQNETDKHSFCESVALPIDFFDKWNNSYNVSMLVPRNEYIVGWLKPNTDIDTELESVKNKKSFSSIFQKQSVNKKESQNEIEQIEKKYEKVLKSENLISKPVLNIKKNKPKVEEVKKEKITKPVVVKKTKNIEPQVVYQSNDTTQKKISLLARLKNKLKSGGYKPYDNKPVAKPNYDYSKKANSKPIVKTFPKADTANKRNFSKSKVNHLYSNVKKSVSVVSNETKYAKKDTVKMISSKKKVTTKNEGNTGKIAKIEVIKAEGKDTAKTKLFDKIKKSFKTGGYEPYKNNQKTNQTSPIAKVVKDTVKISIPPKEVKPNVVVKKVNPNASLPAVTKKENTKTKATPFVIVKKDPNKTTQKRIKNKNSEEDDSFWAKLKKSFKSDKEIAKQNTVTPVNNPKATILIKEVESNVKTSNKETIPAKEVIQLKEKDVEIVNEIKQLNLPNSKNGKASLFYVGPKNGKFYVVTNLAKKGEIVKVTNTSNGKYIMAEVINSLPNADISKGLLAKISDNAKLPLGVSNAVFFIKVNY